MSLTTITHPCALPACHQDFIVFAGSHQRYCKPECAGEARCKLTKDEPVQAPAGSFGATLRDYREARDRSRNSLAKECGVDPSYLARCEYGERSPARSHIIDALARSLRLTTMEHSRLLVSAGYAPVLVARIGWCDALDDIATVLANPELSEQEREDFRSVIRLVSARFKPSLGTQVRRAG